MKKIYLFTAIVLFTWNAIAQIEGTWRLAPAAGSLAPRKVKPHTAVNAEENPNEKSPTP